MFDYVIDESSLSESIQFTLFEVGLLAAVFYINLHILIPRFFTKKNNVLYWIALLGVMALSFLTYMITGLDAILLADTTWRAILSFVLNHGLFVFISAMIWYFQRYTGEQLKNLQLEKDKLDLEISLLKSQISPHFLFNTLNNIYSLAVVKDDNTPKMLAATSDILRYYVNNGQNKLVPLQAEIEILEQYITTQKMRKLRGNLLVEIPPSTSRYTFSIPPLVLLTLLENAFKHGDISTKETGFVNIQLSYVEDAVHFEIVNSYQSKGEKNGIGLQNIRSQLDLVFGSNYDLALNDQASIYSVKLKFNGN